MIEPGFFIAIGSLGVTIAGFAAIMYSLRPSGELEPVTAWRIRYIVTGGFTIAAVSLGVAGLPVFTDDPRLQVRLASLLGMSSVVPSLWTVRSLSDRRVFATRHEAVGWVAAGVVYLGLHGLNVLIASHRLLVTMWVLMLVAAMSIFVSEIREIYSPHDENATDESANR